MKTKQSIVDKARELFNERGSSRVSTNHVAAALGISPGNLYYHYRNKAEIVRAIFDQLEAATAPVWDEARLSSLADFEAVLDRHFDACAPFAFLGRELADLMRADAELRDCVQAFVERRELQVRGFLGSLHAHRDGAVSGELVGRARLVASLLVLWPAHATVGPGAERPAKVLRSLVLAP